MCRRGMASLSPDVQQYNSRIGHHVVESKRRALHVVEARVYAHVGHVSIVDRAHLEVLEMLAPLLVKMYYERSHFVR